MGYDLKKHLKFIAKTVKSGAQAKHHLVSRLTALMLLQIRPLEMYLKIKAP